jgi:hypothetical protein
LFHRLLEMPKDRSFFVFGLRGVGKSTWSRQSLRSRGKQSPETSG